MHGRPRTLAFCLAVLSSIGIAWPASATTVEERSLRDLAVESPTIVHGTVVSTESRWNDDRSLVITEVRVQVDTAIKGTAAGEVIVVRPGGRVGKIRVDVSGSAAFQPGQETVLFLKPYGSRGSIVTGLFQGRFDVARDARGRKVVRGLSGDELRALQNASARTGGGRVRAVAGAPVALDEFLGGVRSLLEDIRLEGGR